MRRIYLDNNATTPTDPRVVQDMLPYFTDVFGNPHSDAHSYGWEASEAVESARKHVAKLIGADAREIVFTSGATESCGIALQGVCRRAASGRRKIVTVSTEHACVLETCRALRKEGFELVELPVERDGLVDWEALRGAIDSRTLIVSVMLANNEIGVIQSIQEIAALCKAAGALLHTDATQAVGKIPVDAHALGVDLLSCSAHKLYGPKGVGALYVRWGVSDAIEPLTAGGSQEGGLRPGTVAVPLVVGFGSAARIARNQLERDMAHTRNLAEMLYDRLRAQVSEVHLYGHSSRRLPGNLNVGFPGVPGETIIDRVGERLAVSTGSACSSTTAEPSHVLSAIEPHGSTAAEGVRIGIGRFNEPDDIEAAAGILIQAAGH